MLMMKPRSTTYNLSPGSLRKLLPKTILLRESSIKPSNVGSIMEDAFNDRMVQFIRDSEEYLQKVW